MFYDITGQKFGRLKVIERKKNVMSLSGNAMWLCKCDCGNITVVDSYLLRHGLTRSCGCLLRESSKKRVQSNEKFLKNMGDASKLSKNGIPFVSTNIGKKNKSGVVGISFDETSGKWIARMMHNKRYVLNSAFASKQEAIEARKKAELVYFKA